jgi:hypothetical protein
LGIVVGAGGWFRGDVGAGEMLAVDLLFQGECGVRAGGAEGFAVVIDGTVRVDGE